MNKWIMAFAPLLACWTSLLYIRTVKAIGIAALILTTANPLALSAFEMTPEMQQRLNAYRKQKNQINLVGWRSILFYCSLPDEPDKDLKDICERTQRSAEFFAAAGKVSLRTAKDAYEVGENSIVED